MSEYVMISTYSGPHINVSTSALRGGRKFFYMNAASGYVTREHWEQIQRYQAFPVPNHPDLKQFCLNLSVFGNVHVPGLSDRPDADWLLEVLRYSNGEFLWEFDLQVPELGNSDFRGGEYGGYYRALVLLGVDHDPQDPTLYPSRFVEWSEVQVLQWEAMREIVVRTRSMTDEQCAAIAADLAPWTKEQV